MYPQDKFTHIVPEGATGIGDGGGNNGNAKGSGNSTMGGGSKCKEARSTAGHVNSSEGGSEAQPTASSNEMVHA